MGTALPLPLPHGSPPRPHPTATPHGHTAATWPICNPHPIPLPTFPAPYPHRCPTAHLQPLSYSHPRCPTATPLLRGSSPTLILQLWPLTTAPRLTFNPYPTAFPAAPRTCRCPTAHLQPLPCTLTRCPCPTAVPLPHRPSPTLTLQPSLLPHDHATAHDPSPTPAPHASHHLLDLAVKVLVQGRVEDGLTLRERPGPRRGAQGGLRRWRAKS